MKQLTVSGSVPPQAKQLQEYASELPVSFRDDEDAHTLWRRITSVIFVIDILAFVVYFIVALLNDGNSVVNNSMLYMLTEGIVGVLIAFALLYVVYNLLYRLFTLIIRPYYAADDQPNKLAAAAQTY